MSNEKIKSIVRGHDIKYSMYLAIMPDTFSKSLYPELVLASKKREAAAIMAQHIVDIADWDISTELSTDEAAVKRVCFEAYVMNSQKLHDLLRDVYEAGLIDGVKAQAENQAQQAQSVLAQEEWIEWAGGERPVASNVMVEYQRRKGVTHSRVASGLHWNHNCRRSAFDIVRYRVVQKND